jgi:hypothetical protein
LSWLTKLLALNVKWLSSRLVSRLVVVKINEALALVAIASSLGKIRFSRVASGAGAGMATTPA